MGIQTFQRSNGDRLNSALKWSEEGPTSPLGHVRWEIVEKALAQAHRHGQTLAIRLMPYDQKHPLPVWYQKSGAKRANAEGAPIWEPDFSDPLYLKYWGDLVKEAGRRFDGHPDLDTVDISSVGYWGKAGATTCPHSRTRRS